MCCGCLISFIEGIASELGRITGSLDLYQNMQRVLITDYYFFSELQRSIFSHR